MSAELLRLIISGLATLLLAREATRATGGSRRRQSFALGAAGFGLLALGNALAFLGVGAPVILTLASGIGLALLLGALVSIYLAYRGGELSDQFRRAGAMVAEEREKLAERDRRDQDDHQTRG